MVRKYVKKRKKYIFNEGELKLATDEVEKGKSIKSVALAFGIPLEKNYSSK